MGKQACEEYGLARAREGEVEKHKHDLAQLEAKCQRKRERKAELKKEVAELQEKQLGARRSAEQLGNEVTQTKSDLNRAKDEQKRLQDENSALNIKLQTEMASLAFWLQVRASDKRDVPEHGGQEHKDLTAEMEGERVIHKARVHKLEDRLASMEEQLSKVNEEKRESQKHVRDDLRQSKHGHTALTVAVAKGHEAINEALVEAKARQKMPHVTLFAVAAAAAATILGVFASRRSCK